MSKHEYGIMHTQTGEIMHDRLDEEKANAVMRDLKEGAWCIVRRSVSDWEQMNASSMETLLLNAPKNMSLLNGNLPDDLIGNTRRPANIIFYHLPSCEREGGRDLLVSWVESLGNKSEGHIRHLMENGNLNNVISDTDDSVRSYIVDKIEDFATRASWTTRVFWDEYAEEITQETHGDDPVLAFTAEYMGLYPVTTMDGVREMIKPFLETMNEITDVNNENYMFGEKFTDLPPIDRTRYMF